MVVDTNVTAIIGRLTRDAELKTNGMPIGFFTIATNRRRKDPNGNPIPEASFFDVKVIGTYAEKMVPDLKKGVQVSIIGELEQERWIDKETLQRKSRVMLKANSIQIIGGRN